MIAKFGALVRSSHLTKQKNFCFASQDGGIAMMQWYAHPLYGHTVVQACTQLKCSVLPLCCMFQEPPCAVEPQAYLHGLLPVYCSLSKLMSTAQCVNMLLDPELKQDVVCEHVPFGVNCNSSFIVNMNCLSYSKGILCLWGHESGMEANVHCQLMNVEKSPFHLLCPTKFVKDVIAASRVLMSKGWL